MAMKAEEEFSVMVADRSLEKDMAGWLGWSFGCNRLLTNNSIYGNSN